MIYKRKFFNYIIFLQAVLFLSACVGTIKSVNPLNTTALKTGVGSTIQTYPGILSAKAIADTKIDVFFPPIEGDGDKIAYVIRYSGQQIPIYIQASALRPNYKGQLKYTITGLMPDSRFDFNIQARDIVTGAESTNQSSSGDKTFGNTTANFSGISEVRNLNGSNGLTGLEVFWNEGEMKGGIASPAEGDPAQYQITAIDSNSATPGNMNDKSFGEPIRKVFQVNLGQRSAIINGLKANTKYYLQVRCIQSGYSANSSNPNYRVEENTNYLSISTYSDSLSGLNFNINSFTANYPAGSGGFFAFNGKWTAPIGNFDHYRIYYSLHTNLVAKNTTLTAYLNSSNTDTKSMASANCFGEEINGVTHTGIFCEAIDYRNSNYLLTGLTPYQTYDTVFVVCLTADCRDFNKRILSTNQQYITNPVTADFKGISEIVNATQLSDLNKLTLKFLAPDYSTGNIAGLMVEYFDSSLSTATAHVLNHPNPILSSDKNDTAFTVDNFNYLTDTSITISGIDPSSTNDYCFVVYPYNYNLDGTLNLSQEPKFAKKCIKANIIAPTKLEFTGFANGNCTKTVTGNIGLDWVLPTSGIYDHFEIYYKKGGNFNFTDAVLGNSAYTKTTLDGTILSAYFSNLDPGADYQFGIITFYQAITGPVRSEFNTSIMDCNYPTVP